MKKFKLEVGNLDINIQNNIKIEGEGQKAFYDDDSDFDREIEADMCYPQRFNNRYPELAEKVMKI